MIIRPTQIADLDAVARLMRDSYAAPIHPYLTYAQHGVAAYLARIVAHPDLFPDFRPMTVADDSGAVRGFAEFHIVGADGFLSHICIAAEARRTGLASRLIQDFFVRHPQVKRLDLDVFDDNDPALRLYDRLGFTGDAKIAWLVRPLPEAMEGPLRFDNAAAALAVLDAHGFCELSAQWDGRHRRLGRIGGHVLRCFDPETFEDGALLAAARFLFPHLGEALAIVPATQANALRDWQIAASLRLTLAP